MDDREIMVDFDKIKRERVQGRPPEVMAENAKKNSCKNINPEIQETNYNEAKKNTGGWLKPVAAFIAGAIVAAAMASAVIAIKNDKLRDSVLDEPRSIVDSQRYINENGYSIYSERGVAIEILKQEDFDLAIYGVYKTVSSDPDKKIPKMNEIIGEMSSVVANNPEYDRGIQLPESFDEYLQGRGFVDENGQVSLDKYEQKLDDYALAVAKYKQATPNLDITDANSGKSM